MFELRRFVLVVDGEERNTAISANDGLWHHICVAWRSVDGRWLVTKDGNVADEGMGLAIGKILKRELNGRLRRVTLK